MKKSLLSLAVLASAFAFTAVPAAASTTNTFTFHFSAFSETAAERNAHLTGHLLCRNAGFAWADVEVVYLTGSANTWQGYAIATCLD